MTPLAFGQTVTATPPSDRAANAPDQKPAFEGQTRAPEPDMLTKVNVTTVVEGLPRAWALEFLPDGRMLVTAKSGELHIVSTGGEIGPALKGVPKVDARGQGGLLDVVLSPDFATDGMVYFSFSGPREGGNGTSVARGKLVETEGSAELQDVAVIFRQMPSWNSDKHYGSRLVFAPDGMLYVTVGERSLPGPRVQAQDVGSGLGKVFRINPDGSVPKDNPFVGREGAQPEIWSYGHRNLQSATLDGQGRLWTVEHGPKGGDELNRPQPGLNYGWPVITYGVEYSGKPVGKGITAQEGMEQPIYYWDPVIGPSGMAHYEGDAFETWKGAFLIGGLVNQALVVLHMEGDRVAHEEWVPLDARIRDVKIGSDGHVYALTEGGGGSRVLKLSPAEG
nr:PQQ-dependent sugar dehydrogenase [Rhodoligotrophos appendicifer]